MRSGQAKRAGNLYICMTPNHLLSALIDAMTRQEPACILFAEDSVVLPPAVSQALKNASPDIELIRTKERQEQENFATLPAWAPPLLRRNLRFRAWRLETPQRWRMPVLGHRRFQTAYIFHSGPFIAKASRAVAQEVVLREDGVSNYVSTALPIHKRLLRALSWRWKREAILGEENWIDRLELSRIAALPPNLKAKARHYQRTEKAATLSPDAMETLARIFQMEPVSDTVEPARQALLLTQPLVEAGLADHNTAHHLYSQITQALRRYGYSVTIKPHPLEKSPITGGQNRLPAFTPIELWSYLGRPKFSAAVALCSAALMEGAPLLADHSVQLLKPKEFHRDRSSEWSGLIEVRLKQALSATHPPSIACNMVK